MNNEDIQGEKTQDELELIDPKNVARVLEGFVNALALQKQTKKRLFIEENLT